MILAIDSETTGTDRWHGCKPFLVTGCDGRHNYHFSGTVNPYNRMEVVWDEGTLQEVQALLDEASILVFHNAKFDLHMLESIGIDLTHLWHKVEDTLLAFHCLCSGEPHGLKYLARKYMDYPADDEKELGAAVRAARAEHPDYDLARLGHPSFPGIGGQKTSWYKMDYWLSLEACLTYGLGDVERTWGLWQIAAEALQKYELMSVYHTRKQLIKIFFDMETVGYHVYADEVRDEIAYLTDLRASLQLKIMKEAGIKGKFDLTKEESLRFFLFTILKIEPVHFTKAKGMPSISQDAVDYMIESNPDVPALQYFQEYRTAGTQIGYLKSYLKWVCDDNRIRGSVFITGTRNTRQSYKEPNLQNIDGRLTNIFGPPPGYVWINYDLVSIEPRIWAYLTGNKELIGELEAGRSTHLLFSQLLLPEMLERLGTEAFKETPQYGNVKAGGLSIMYGASAKRADNTFKLAGAFAKIAERMPELPAFNQQCADEVLTNLERHHAPWVTCLGGYKLDVPLDDIYVAPNYKIQGGAGFIIGEAMINVKHNKDYISTKSEMVLQVHDSIKVEVHESQFSMPLVHSMQHSIEAAVLKYLPTGKASYEIIRNEQAPF